MTLPGDQWLVGKRVYEEIRLMFERKGRKLSYRKVAVRLADAKVENLSPHEREVAVVAAHVEIKED